MNSKKSKYSIIIGAYNTKIFKIDFNSVLTKVTKILN